MKKKLLASALTTLGMIGAAHAVHVNPDGLGQVLLYPYYDVQSGFDTYVHVVNTTSAVKAVKVRFLEGKNSQEVLDFNLYLSPKDEWTGVLVRSATGTKLSTVDTSCTAPAIPAGGVEFRNLRYQTDDINKGTDRTREGYIEIIEMGNITGSVATAATHVDGVPLDCAAVRAAANVASGNLPADGGLYGFNTLINVEAGMATTLDAVALDDFWLNDLGVYTNPGSLLPSLENTTQTADILDGNTVVTGTFAPSTADAVSAILMRTNVINDYVVAPEIAAMTDWVITFPTKRFYVNEPATALPPFQNIWNTEKTISCDSIGITYFDREEKTTVAGDDDFSPKPDTPTASLCNEVNTVSMVPTGDTGKVFGAEFTNAQITLDPGFTSGWMEIAFNSTAAATTGLDSLDGVNVRGLPVIGFSAMSFTNGTMEVDGVNVLSNYLGSSVHKGQRAIFQE